VTKKVRDSRQDPPAPDEPAATNYRVDRVFATPRTTTRDPSQVASELLARRPSTTAPPFTGAPGEDVEVSLRRQLSRLQRQLAEAQRELANKDDELAAEAEKRMALVSAHDAALEQLRTHQAQLEDLPALEARARGLEQRLTEAIAAADELADVVEKERRAASIADANAAGLQRSFDETRTLWNTERKTLEERAAAENAQLEAQRKAAVTAGEEALAQATARMTEAHEAELAQLREAHERSLSTLRGELEPKVAEARTIAEDRERLASKVAALEADAVRATAERDEERTRTQAQLAEQHAAELAAHARTHAAELASAIAERDGQLVQLQQAVRTAEDRAKAADDELATLREAHKKLQRDAAEASERAGQLEADKQLVEDRLQLAVATAEKLLEAQKQLREQLDAAERETRRNAMDRLRFVAYLEEGLALLGALPPAAEQPEPPEIETEIEPGPLPEPGKD
jgi:chromosome segregation ATPase